MIKSIAKKSTTGSLPPAVPLAITPTFSPWTHTSDDSYIYQLSLVLATATVSSGLLAAHYSVVFDNQCTQQYMHVYIYIHTSVTSVLAVWTRYVVFCLYSDECIPTFHVVHLSTADHVRIIESRGGILRPTRLFLLPLSVETTTNLVE